MEAKNIHWTLLLCCCLQMATNHPQLKGRKPHCLATTSMQNNGRLIYYYYYWYSALGPVWAETRAQSGDWYGSGTLHHGQVLTGSLPLLSLYINPKETSNPWNPQRITTHNFSPPNCRKYYYQSSYLNKPDYTLCWNKYSAINITTNMAFRTTMSKDWRPSNNNTWKPKILWRFTSRGFYG